MGQIFLALGLKPLISVLTSPSLPRDRPRAPTLKAVAPLVRGILLAVPIVLLFGALLASADVVFSSRVQGVIDVFESLFSRVQAGELVFRALLILSFSYLAAAAMLHGLRRAPGAERPGSGELERMFPELDVSRLPRLGVVESSIVLGSVNVLFAAFVFIQFRYLFGGRANIDAEGFTFAEYARQGFGELLGVAVLSLLLLFVLSVASRAEKPGSRRLFTILGIALVLFVGVILVSAFQRLLLYEEAFGFTRARTWGHVFMVWLGLVLLALVILQATSRLRFFALAFLTAAVGFVLSLAILDVDSFIVERNMQRAHAGAELDLAYLTSLSQDAVPAMVEAFEKAPSELRLELGAALVCFARELEIPHDGWRTSHLSALRARKALAAVAPDLEDHRTADCPHDWTI